MDDARLTDEGLARVFDEPRRRLSGAARALVAFWVFVLSALVTGAVILQTLGPPEPETGPGPDAAAPSQPPPPQAAETPPAPAPAAEAAPEPIRPGRDSAGPISAPDPGLLERTDDGVLPRVSVDGRVPMQVYARGFDRTSQRPRIGLVFAGFGPNGTDSLDAAKALPGAVTVAVTPYSPGPPERDRFQTLLDAVRLAGHEFLLSLPMEPANFPLSDPGDHALLTGATPEINARRLIWALGRIEGYAGTTGAMGPMRGERFEASAGPMGDVLRELAARGLFFVDARSSADGANAALPAAWGRFVDLVIDEPATRADIDAKLAKLEEIARARGSALGLAGVPRPVTVQRVTQWAAGLQDRGPVLAPASAMMLAPAGPQ